jgi:methylthioribose-1-phosphate isomerase
VAIVAGVSRVETLRSAVEWRDGVLEAIDQTLLPDRLELRRLTTVEEVTDAIRRLVVRGAPAIGIAGAFGVVLGIREGRDADEAAAELEAARPTAVNLSYAVRRVARAARAGGEHAAEQEAVAIAERDRESCRRIGEFGREELARASRLLTHCNTGRLATGGIGTALGVVYAKALAGEPVEVLASETRPLLQGARLTAWELADAGIPVTLLADGAGGSAMASGRVDAVIVGCDRVARNGDTANKIGTYAHAVLARAHGIPFYVAGPMSSFDPDTPTGEEIVVEERGAEELTHLDVSVWNPAFDVTPAEYVTAFVTDVGVLRPPFARSIAEALALAEAEGLR